MNYLSLFAPLLLAVVMAAPLQADEYLSNTDLHEGIVCWRGDGRMAYLKPDGTEGEEGDPDVTPVIKLALSRDQMRSVYQDFSVHEQPTTLHVKVEVYGSADFKPASDKTDYEDMQMRTELMGTSSYRPLLNANFWLFFGPDYWGKMARIPLKKWVTIEERFSKVDNDEDRAINFCVPPGAGAVYLRNPSVTK